MLRNNKKFRIINIAAAILGLVFILLSFFFVPIGNYPKESTFADMTYVELTKKANDNKIKTLYYDATVNECFVEDTDGIYYKTYNSGENFIENFSSKNIIIKSKTELNTFENIKNRICGKFATTGILFFVLAAIMGLVAYINRDPNDDAVVIGGVKSNKNSSNSDEQDINVKKFSDIAGLYEVKKDVKCLVDFLVNKDKYTEAGAKLPKGVILYGPPGTGKTLLAKAIAGEAGVPFLYMSGSEFIEMYVGVGAKRVRELFTKAKKQAPCIIFIDEIDTIGGKRHNEDNSEDRKTINALLTEMDGFKPTENIIVIAATNRLEDLDPALTRPGRFTNKYCVPLPETVKERLEIINLYIQDKKIAEDLDLESLARECIDFSPAKIEALLNEAAIISVQEGKGIITKEFVDKAMYKILLQGHMKENNSERSKEELELVAWHEAGHAVVGKIFGKEITKVTIISSTSGAGGVTFSTPTKTHLLSTVDIKHEIMELYGGRIGELLYYNEEKQNITTGASNDIERATALINDYILKYGMSENFGPLNLEHEKSLESTLIESKVDLAKEVYNSTFKLLKNNSKLLEEVANLLIDNETIYSTDLEEIFKKYKIMK